MRDDDDAARERDAAPEGERTAEDRSTCEAPDREEPDGDEREPDREPDGEEREPDREEPDREEREVEPGIGARERAVREEEERRGVPRTTTTGDPATDVRQPGDGAITDLEADAGEDPSLPDELRRGRCRPPPTGRTPPDDEPSGAR
jgi:hypothetical protein